MSEKQNAPHAGKETAAKTQKNDKPLDKEIHDLISEAIGPLWEKLKVDTAIVIARVPDTDKMSIYYRGHFYDVATLLTKVSNQFTDQIDRDLGRGGR